MPGGRPSSYTPEIADEICHRISEGEGLISICAGESMPDKSTVFRWLQVNPEFQDKYTRAREIQADIQSDEILHIADTEEDVNRAKVRIDARKWTASKLKPKKYGSFQQVDLTSDNHTTHSVDAQSVEQAAASVLKLLNNCRT